MCVCKYDLCLLLFYVETIPTEWILTKLRNNLHDLNNKIHTDIINNMLSKIIYAGETVGRS